MGTDIHPIVQRRVAGAWQTVLLSESPQTSDGWPILSERNYILFAVLADVRNGYGAAGVYRHDPVAPIAPPRGLPDDWSDHRSDLGDHSHSWLMLRELLAYDWDQSITKGGVISAEQFEAWDQRSEPDSYSGGVYSLRHQTVTPEDYRAGRFDLDKVIMVAVRWRSTLRQEVSAFVRVILPWLATLGAPDEVRVVFGFDS